MLLVVVPTTMLLVVVPTTHASGRGAHDPPLPMLLVVVPTTHACDMRAIGAQAIRAQAM